MNPYPAFQKIAENGILGALLVVALFTVAFLFKSLINEKDKEIKASKENEQKVTLVLGEVDNTLQAILIDLKHHHHDQDEKTETK